MEKTAVNGSQHVKMFLDFVDRAKADYVYCLEAMKNEEKITQDYLNLLELNGLNYHERSKIATKLVTNRQARRTYKDAVEELQPIVEFFEDPKNKAFLNSMSQLLGQIRKIENYHQNRHYVPKVVAMPNPKKDEKVS